MRYEWLISTRYLMARRRTMLSLITLISIIGVAVGIAVLIFVLSVLGGFATDLREKILGAKAHVVVSAERGDLARSDEIVRVAEEIPEVVGATAYIETEVMITSASSVVGIVLRGIDPRRVGRTSSLVDDMVDGRLEWLEVPEEALRAWLINEPPDYREFMEEYDQVREDIESMQRGTEALHREIEEGVEFARRWQRERDLQRTTATLGSGEGSGEGSGGASAGEPVMRLLPGQGSRRAEPSEGTGRAAGESPMEPVRPSPAEDRRVRVPGIVIGTELAASLHVSVGEEVTIINPVGQLLPSGPAPSTRPFVVVGLFYSGLYEFDRRNAYILTEEARDLLRMPEGAVSAVDIKVKDLDQAGSVQRTLAASLAGQGFESLLVRSWEELNKSLFSALKLEKVALFIILTIIILVASFSIASSLVVLVIERAAEIGILKSMGASNREIKSIFAIAGGLIGLVGTMLGVLVGVGLCLVLAKYGWRLDTDVYYIEYLPIHLEPVEVLLTALAGLVISLLATVYPAMKAARLNPAQALRND